jgi:hypothetical protein
LIPDNIAMQPQLTPQAAILHVIAGHWLARAVYLAARLKLVDAVGDKTTLEDLAKATGTRSAALRRVMRALTSHGYFREESDGAFVQTPLSEALKSNSPCSMRAIAEAELGHHHYDSWREIESCLRGEGTAFERVYQKPIWQYYAEHPEAQALFGQAMTDLTAMANAGVFAVYQTKPFKMAVDMGGGHGAFLQAILGQQPAAKGILFDLPSVIADAIKQEAIGRNNRIQVIGGDFFKEVPAGGDLYLLKFILHDWDEESSLKLLTNIRKAIAADGRLAVVEIVLPPGNEPHIGPLIDLNMMVMTGGAERTEREYAQLLNKSGFRLDRLITTKSPFSIIEAVPV